MGAGTAEQIQVEKKCYKNNTAGWLGVVKLDHLGAQVGESVEPFGEVWLTQAEAILTARAPKDPANNPFVEQIFQGEDAQGGRHPMPITPLTLSETENGTASERFVPSSPPEGETSEQLAARKRETEAALAGPSERDRTIPLAPVVQPAPSSAAAATAPATSAAAPVSTSEAGEEEQKSWTDPPANWTPQPQKGSLGGGAAPAGPVDDDDARDGTPQGAPPQAPVLQQVGQVPEETAATLPSGEETGAAETPAGQAPEGEYASHEEVGSPDAPAADDKTED